MWRRFRENIKLTLKVNFRYQYRLTKYLIRFNKIIRFKAYFVYELQLKNILTLARFFPDYHWSLFFIKNNLVYVNNIKINNEFNQLFVNDFLQILISIKYYVLYRWLRYWNYLKSNKIRTRINKKLYKKIPTDQDENKEKYTKYSLPSWLLKHVYFMEDLPKYLELDFFSMSFFVLYEPTYLFDYNPLSIVNSPYNIINLYNWKYIN